jgi:methyl-accepting chemotaxis protein
MATNRLRKTANSKSPIEDSTEPTQEPTQTDNSTTDIQLQPLLAALKAAKNGDFSVRLPEDNGLGEIAAVFNGWVSLNQDFAQEVARLADEIGTEGKLGSEAVVKGAKGSWRQLLDNLNKMSANVSEQIKTINEVTLVVAQGNLSQQIETTTNAGEFKHLRDNTNQMISRLRSSIRQMADVATAVASSAEELTAVSKEMTDNAKQTSEQANQNTFTVVTAVEEMNASIREIAKNVAEGAKVANEAVRTADRTNQTIDKLGQSSIEIGKVIKVITSIAQQTNLLALNATIEAARAGDAGRGCQRSQRISQANRQRHRRYQPTYRSHPS